MIARAPIGPDSDPGATALPRGWLACDVALAAAHDVALCDLDGVVYVGPDAVPHAAEALAAARERHGMRPGYVTNNAARPPREVAEHLLRLGVQATPQDVVTSAQAGAGMLAKRLPPGSRVLFIGGAGVPEALRERGLVPVASIEDEPAALIQGYGRDVGWEQLAQGSYALFRGLPWVATNTDRTIPTPLGRALGNGSLVAALAFATGATPEVAGKPEPPLMLESVARMRAKNPVVVGDRLDTDIEGANRSGLPSLLVLTGVTDWPELLLAEPVRRPSYVAGDLRGLLEAHPEVTVASDGGDLVGRCRGVRVLATSSPAGSGVASSLTRTADWLAALGAAPGPGVDLDLVRAAVAVAWAAADQGLAVTALRLAAAS